MPAKLIKRSAARLAAVQALYQMEVGGADLGDILQEFEIEWPAHGEDNEPRLDAEAKFFRTLVEGVVREQRALDPLVDAALKESWPLGRVEAVLRAVLRAGAYELAYMQEVPARVVVSEYVDVAAAFLNRHETGMVNAVLDQLARKLRAAEFEQAR